MLKYSQCCTVGIPTLNIGRCEWRITHDEERNQERRSRTPAKELNSKSTGLEKSRPNLM